MNNLDVRILVSNSHLLYRDIADQMNISRTHLSRLMREPLSANNKIRVLRAIEELKAEGVEAKDDIQ